MGNMFHERAVLGLGQRHRHVLFIALMLPNVSAFLLLPKACPVDGGSISSSSGAHRSVATYSIHRSLQPTRCRARSETALRAVGGAESASKGVDVSLGQSEALQEAGSGVSQEESSAPESFTSFWFHDTINDDLSIKLRLSKVLHDTRSEFQSIQVVESVPYGKTLILDGKTQSAQLDEFIYHEALVHPALLAHPNPKRVYIGGGGELATAREVLRHRSVEKCVMVDLDKVVVDTSKELLPDWGAGATDDPRLELHYMDAHAYLKDNDETYDVIIMDIADPIEAGPGYVLYTQEFYEFATSRLTPGGILVTQSGAAAPHLRNECFTVIHRTLKSAFKNVAPMVADIPSFGSNWGFNLATDGDGLNLVDVRRKDPATTDEQIASRIRGGLRFYDGVTHLGLFGVPKWLRAAVEAETRIMTYDTPVFVYSDQPIP